MTGNGRRITLTNCVQVSYLLVKTLLLILFNIIVGWTVYLDSCHCNDYLWYLRVRDHLVYVDGTGVSKMDEQSLFSATLRQILILYIQCL